MIDQLALPPLQRMVLKILAEKSGRIVEYRAFESVLSCKKDRNMIAHSIYRLRKRGLRIDNISGVGYRLRPKRKSALQVVSMTEQDEVFASEIQDAISGVMKRHAQDVGFESQLAIMAVAIGAMLNQLPDYECRHFTNVFVRNLNEAPQLSETMNIQ